MTKVISPRSATRINNFDPNGTVFSHYTALANKFNAINLGQGFPNLPIDKFILDSIQKASQVPLYHQYTRSEGHPRLVNAISRYYEPLLKKLDVNTEIMTSVGASEAIFCAMQALINPGDEVIIMQPFFDSYPATVSLSGGIPVYVSIRKENDYKLDFEELESKINKKTKMIILNNPNNPLGKVWSKSELLQLAQIVSKYDLLVLADEVYETLVYEGEMIKFASLPNMFANTITVGSLGKMLGITGWRIGWAIAPPEIIRSMWLVHQFLPFSASTPLQEAGASCFEHAMDTGYFAKTRFQYQALRDKLFAGLDKANFKPIMPASGQLF